MREFELIVVIKLCLQFAPAAILCRKVSDVVSSMSIHKQTGQIMKIKGVLRVPFSPLILFPTSEIVSRRYRIAFRSSIRS